MEEKYERDIDQEIAEALLELPITFVVGKRRMEIRPKTLGQEIMLRQYRMKLGIDGANLQYNTMAEALRLADTKPDETARFVAIHTLHGRADVTDARKIERRARELLKEATTEDLASLLVMCIDSDTKVERFMRHAKLDKDRENIRKINQVKAVRNVYTFNGKTLWGELIGAACERFGWSMEYVLWGISLTNLQMLFVDQSVTMSLTDDERRKVSLANVHDSIRVDDPANAAIVKQIIKNIE